MRHFLLTNAQALLVNFAFRVASSNALPKSLLGLVKRCSKVKPGRVHEIKRYTQVYVDDEKRALIFALDSSSNWPSLGKPLFQFTIDEHVIMSH